MSIKDNLYQILSKIPSHVKLVAVSKTKTADEIMEVYNEDVRDFGENKVQELLSKVDALPMDIRWHLIGHLQTNKVKYIAPFVHCIQSVDSLKLLKEINKEAIKNNRLIHCLLQVHIAREETKFGFSEEELVECLENEEFKALHHISVGGLMGMATYTSDEAVVMKEFTYLKQIFGKLKQNYFATNEDFKDISMGMSSDFELAINCGSTIVRVGSSIFGKRPKKV
jgi:pyridoxal phosphate enzyme (YggS family)